MMQMLRAISKHILAKQTHSKVVSHCHTIMDEDTFKPKDNIGKMKIVPLTSSPYLKPLRAEFEMNGKKRYWDLIQAHDSVSILLFNVTRKVFVFVRQFRPSLFICGVTKNLQEGIEIDPEKHDLKLGYSIELCAGIVDKDYSLEEIARQEVLEECGYDIPVSSLRKLYSHRNVGILGQKGTIFYAEITDDQKVSEGGGVSDEGESIEVVEMTIENVKKYLDNVDILSPASFTVAIHWFLSNVSYAKKCN